MTSFVSFRAVLAKVFRQADVEESGIVDISVVPSLASKVFGQGTHDRELAIVREKAQQYSGVYKLVCVCVLTHQCVHVCGEGACSTVDGLAFFILISLTCLSVVRQVCCFLSSYLWRLNASVFSVTNRKWVGTELSFFACRVGVQFSSYISTWQCMLLQHCTFKSFIPLHYVPCANVLGVCCICCLWGCTLECSSGHA